MIARLWHGWTKPAEADAYRTLLMTEVFPGILEKRVAGLDRIELLARDCGEEVEFVTIMWFDDLEAVKAFAGEDHEAAYVPAAARRLLARFDRRSAHYEALATERARPAA